MNVKFRDRVFDDQAVMAKRLGVIDGDVRNASDLEKAFSDMAYTG